jgi:hypothetical protein
MPQSTTTPLRTTAPVVETGWAEAVAVIDRLREGQTLPRLDGTGLPDGERVSLETEASYQEWGWSEGQRTREDWSPVQVVVTDQRILVAQPRLGGISLWHVDLENLQLGETDGRWQLDLHPVGINPRVRLTGGSTPLIAVHVAHTVFPETWSRLSGLLPLLEAAP